MVYDLFAIGTPVIDIFAKADDEFVKKWGLDKGSTNFFGREKLESLCDELGDRIVHESAGDNARNVCENIARLGGKVAYAGKIGNDKEGEIFENSLKDAGVASLLDKVEGSTGKIVCLITDDAQRTFVADLGVGEEYMLKSFEGLQGTRYVFSTSITALSEKIIGGNAQGILRKGRETDGMTSVLSLESPSMIAKNREIIVRIADEVDIVFMNHEEMQALGMEEKDIPTLGEIVYLKKGEKGSIVYEVGKPPVHVEPARVMNVVDTTGAGDAFAAGVIFGLSKGMDAVQAAKIGSKVASATISKFGACIPKGFRLS